MNLFQKYGIKEVADVVFYSITTIGDEEFYTPVLFLDTLKVSTLEKAAEKVEARGGKGNKKLITWNFGKEITLNLEDALFSPASMSMIWGGKLNSKLSDYTSAVVKCNLANKYGDLNYSIKAYASPALTDDEWEILFKQAHKLGLDSGSENNLPSVYLPDDNTAEEKAFIEENRQSLIKKYFKRSWEGFDFSSSDIPVIESNGKNDYKYIWLGDRAEFFRAKGDDNFTYIVEPLDLVEMGKDVQPTFQGLLDNQNKDGDYYIAEYTLEARYLLSDPGVTNKWYKPKLNESEDRIMTEVKEEAIFTQTLKAYIRYKKRGGKILIENSNINIPVNFGPIKAFENNGVGYYPSITYLVMNNSQKTEQLEPCLNSIDFLKTIFEENVNDIITEETIGISSDTKGKAIPYLIIQGILSEIDSIEKVGYIDTDIYDTEVIDRMEKCIVKDKKGLTISTAKQKENLFKYYADDRKSSYTIYYDAKTMLPLFRLKDGQILEGTDNFTIKLGTVYYKWTRTVKYKESDDDAILGKTLVIDAETFPDAYKIVGETYIRNQKTGKDQRYQFTIHRANVSTDTSVTLEAEGDPTTFSMQIDVLTPPNDVMMELKQYDVEDDPYEGGTRIVPQKSKYTYTPTNIEYIQEVADKNEEIY